MQSRAEMYDAIKKLHLEQEIKDTFGKNFTQVSNFELNDFLESYDPLTPPIKEVVHKYLTDTFATPPENPQNQYCSAIEKLVQILHKKNILLQSEVDTILN